MLRCLTTIVAFVAIVLGEQRAGAAQAGDFRCDYASKIRCDPSGCKADAVGSAYLLLPR